MSNVAKQQNESMYIISELLKYILIKLIFTTKVNYTYSKMSLYTYCKRLAFQRNPFKIIVRLPHVLNNEINETEQKKISPDILNHLENNPEYSELKNRIPKQLLKKYKSPENMYLINKGAAKHIVNTIQKYLKRNGPLVEVNPGFCFLTEELLKTLKRKVYLYESSHNFNEFLSVSIII